MRVQGLVWRTDLRRAKDAGVDVSERTLETGAKPAGKYPKREIFGRRDGPWASRGALGEAQEASRKHPHLRSWVAIPATPMAEGRWEERVKGSPEPWKRYHNRRQKEFSFKDGPPSPAPVMLRLQTWNFLPRQES